MNTPEGCAKEPKRDDLNSSLGIVKRAVEKTADRLSRSTSLGGKSQPSPRNHSASGRPRRLFSLTRKNRADQKSNDMDQSTENEAAPDTQARPANTARMAGGDESPFIRPPSPSTLASKRPQFQFQGDASMRAGTQTLIQALQAIPWAEDADNEDETQHDASAQDSDSNDESAADAHMASSIHTIHRPVARSKRAALPTSYRAASQRNSPSTLGREASFPEEEEEEEEEEPSPVEDLEGDDFEQGHAAAQPPRSGDTEKSEQDALALIMERKGREKEAQRNAGSRAGSMATVRLKRRTKLADKLRDVFELPGIQEVIAEMPCWLLRSIMLQGYMYLTNSYLCFFAHMPAKEDQVLKSGMLTKKTQRTRRWIKHWFVLKNDALSWYQSSADPYFPHGVADLRYAISCDPINEKDLRVRTNQKTITLNADSVPSRDEWVKAIRKVMFKAQHSGENVKIAIPYTAILDVEKSTAMDFSETIEIKVVDQDDHFSVDSYFFAYFRDISSALDQIRDAVRVSRGQSRGATPQPVLDTTQQPRTQLLVTTSPSPRAGPPSSFGPAPSEQVISPKLGGFKLSSLWRGLSETNSPARMQSVPENAAQQEEFTHITKRGESTFVPLTTSPRALANELTPTNSKVESSYHTYPPSPTPSETLQHPSKEPSSSGGSSAWSVGVPAWLKMPKPSRRTSIGPSVADSTNATPRVSEVYSQGQLRQATGDLGFSVLETPEIAVDADIQEKFRTAFAFGEEETLVGYFPGYLYRLIPVYGRLYISTNYFCFKATGPLTSKTRMIIPIRDVLSTESGRAFHFGHHGLVINLRGHEEMFFEFSHEAKRTALVSLLERRKEDLRNRAAAGEPSTSSDTTRSALIFDDFEPSASSAELDHEGSAVMTHSVTEPMFTSASSTFLKFKPDQPLHFTFLTIGSRGDVQPYIALAKGLLADGHKVRIATHGEFKEWIEAHGIEFGYVGGDPAELMRICVENGMFTVSFLKEGLQKFRGWLDDLFKTSWEACQGTDVLVESPSAMAGYHIAEALQIPYFRAFTMTWSRTRAYPHAFAVPERKMGGSYNYMTYVMFDQVFWRAISGQVNRWRRKTLGLHSTHLDQMEPHKVPFLYNFSPTVVPAPLDWPDWIKITGYWFLDDAEVGANKWSPPSDLVEFIDSAHKQGKKVVYIGFGSIVVSDPKAMTRIVVDAVLRSGVHAILSKGWSDRLHSKGADAGEPEVALPKQIYSVSSVPHDWLFQRIDAACHHGGAGTTGASLRAGIPTIIKPFFGDQFFWADRVEALGIGAGVRKLTIESLTEALVAATTDTKQIERARVVGEQIRSENGVAMAVQALYRDMDYARSLIKHKTEGAGDAVDAENATIRDSHIFDSEGGSPPRSASDWSMLEDNSDSSPVSSSSKRQSLDRRTSSGKADRPGIAKRSSLVANVLSALPDVLTPHALSPHPPSPSRPKAHRLPSSPSPAQ